MTECHWCGMSKTADTLLRAEQLFRDILPKNQKVDAETVRLVAEKVTWVARTIYETVFRPGSMEDGLVMPSFEVAQAEELGAYERCLIAAQAVLLPTPRGEQPENPP